MSIITYRISTKDRSPTCPTTKVGVIGFDARVNDINIRVGAGRAVILVDIVELAGSANQERGSASECVQVVEVNSRAGIREWSLLADSLKSPWRVVPRKLECGHTAALQETETGDVLRLLWSGVDLCVRDNEFHIRGVSQCSQRGPFENSRKRVEMGRIKVMVDVRVGVWVGMRLEPCEISVFVGILLQLDLCKGESRG
jgi:hypothetical protein